MITIYSIHRGLLPLLHHAPDLIALEVFSTEYFSGKNSDSDQIQGYLKTIHHSSTPFLPSKLPYPSSANSTGTVTTYSPFFNSDLSFSSSRAPPAPNHSTSVPTSYSLRRLPGVIDSLKHTHPTYPPTYLPTYILRQQTTMAHTEKLYPRATVKRIIKAHSKKTVSKDVDILVCPPDLSYQNSIPLTPL